MKRMNITCTRCGAVTEYDPAHPQAVCLACGEKLVVGVEQLTEALKGEQKAPGKLRRMLTEPMMGGEAIPDLPTSEEKKPTSFYVKQALMWCGVTLALMGLLMVMYGFAGNLMK